MTAGQKKVVTCPLLLAALLFGGCQSQAEIAENELVILKRSDLCQVAEPTLRQLQSKEDIRRVIAPRAMLDNHQSIPYIDFSTHAIMLLAMGQKPSSGYRIEIDRSRIKENHGVLWLPAQFKSPKNDDMAATMITSPCVIFSLKQNALQKVVAGDTGLVFQF
ncbi:MAG: protease complex subunit PrcB family protein [Candidatus Thiodiazotropha sp.]